MLEKAVAGLVRVCGERAARSRCEEAMAGAVAKQKRWQGQRGSRQVASVHAGAVAAGEGEVWRWKSSRIDGLSEPGELIANERDAISMNSSR